MKNLFSNLAAFFVGVLICVSVLACANDSEEVDNNSNTIATVQDQISKLTSKIEELENKLAEAEEKIDNIEDEIDYELVFQKFNQYFEGCDCNYDEEIEKLTEKIDNIKALSTEDLFPRMTNYKYTSNYGDEISISAEYNDMGRIIKIIEREYYSDHTNINTYSISYNENQCVINSDTRAALTFDSSEISTPALNYFLMGYVIY